MAKKEAHPEKPLVFLHGVFGSGATFKSYAQSAEIQKQRSRSYLVDLRNHGRSEHVHSMCMVEQAMDIHRFLQENAIEDKVTFVGHSLGGKVAMQYSLLFPEKVAGICSIDSSPVDRNDFPAMNSLMDGLIDQACSFLPGIEERSYKEAYKWLGSNLYQNKVLVSSLMINLDKKSIDKARLLINLASISELRQ